MESLETEVCEEMEKRDGRGRRLLNKDQWAEALSAYDKSGMTQVGFCRREGLNYNSFVHQLSKRKNQALAASAPGSKFRQLEVSCSESKSASLEVRLPCGLVVRGSDAEELARLIGLLRA